MKLALKIDVDTYRGTRVGVPRLVELLRRRGAGATFLFSLCWDHVRWQDGVAGADAAWTENELGRARERFIEVFAAAPRSHGAAGWQMNRHALRLTQRLDFAYASDTRGTRPFVPVCDGEIVLCPQLPTTLPTLDELIGVD